MSQALLLFSGKIGGAEEAMWGMWLHTVFSSPALTTRWCVCVCVCNGGWRVGSARESMLTKW